MEKRKINRFCEVAALVLALFALLTLIGTGLTERVHLGTWGGKTEDVAFLPISPVQGAALLLGGMLAALALFALLKRHARLGWALAALWGAAAAILAVGFGTKQVYDAAIVQEAAELFARGNYKMMSADYLNAYPYQLGICLPMEILLRLFPGLNLNLTMQLVNVAMALSAAAAMAALGRTIFEDSRISRACEAAGLLVWPALLFCQQVYGTIPMLFFVSLAMLCYAKYVKTRRRALGAAFACLLALAYAAKINAAVVLLALFICALMHGWARKDGKIVLLAALSFAIGKGTLAAVTAWYAQKGGVTFRANVSMWARLAMGMQESPIAAGWYNNYTERFFSADVTAEQEKAQALADIGAQLCRMRENPAAALAFYREKLLTQWLEPACDMLWSGQLSEKAGRYTGVIRGIYGAPGALRGWMEGYMDTMQTAVYALAAVGGVCALRKKGGAALLMIPVTVLGGALYHLIFEAKAQYAYPYMVYMLPLAAAGLCRLEDGAARLICSGKKWVQRRAECARTSHRD